MNKSVFSVLFVLTFLIPFSEGLSQPDSHRIQGRIDFNPRVNYADVEIRILVDGQQRGVPVRAANNYPHYFDKHIPRQENDSEISLQLIFNDPSNYLRDPKEPTTYFGAGTRIKCKKIEDIYFDLKEDLNKYFEQQLKDTYPEAIKRTEDFLNKAKNLSKRQEYYLRLYLSRLYADSNNEETALVVLNSFQFEQDELKDFEIYEFSMYKAKRYFNLRQFDEHQKVLSDLYAVGIIDKVDSARSEKYFKERFDGLLKLGNYNSYKNYPALEFIQYASKDGTESQVMSMLNEYVKSYNTYYNKEINPFEIGSITNSDLENFQILSNMIF